MDRLEQRLHDLLTNDRHALREDLVPLDRVHAGANRRRRRRVAALSGATAVVLAAVAVPLALTVGNDRPSFSEGSGTISSAPTGHASAGPTVSSNPTPSSAPLLAGPPWDGARVTSVTATSTRTLVVLGALGDSGACRPPNCVRLAESHDGGATFTALPVPDDALASGVDGTTRRSASNVRFGSAQDGWLFGDGLWATHDGGDSWAEVKLPGRVTRLEAATGRAWALVTDPSDSSKAQLWTSPVKTDEWRRVDSVSVDFEADLALQRSRVIVVGANSSNSWVGDGKTFVERPGPCDSPALKVELSASGSLWAKCVTGMAAYVATSANGEHWRTVKPKGLDQMMPNSLTIGARGTDDALLASDPEQPLVQLRSDGTRVSVRKPPVTGVAVSYLGFTTPDVGYAVVADSLWRTEDGGDTWSKLTIG